jgi:hypothetical protein
MINYGDLYNKAASSFENLSQQDKMASQGLYLQFVDESGNPHYVNAAGETAQTGDMSTAEFANQQVPFNSQDWFNQQGIIPVSGRFDPNIREGIQDAVAQKYGFPNYDVMLRYTTGPGQYVNDPSLGLLWVPNNKDYQSWNRDYVGALNQSIRDPITSFVDRGGLVAALASGIGGLSGAIGAAPAAEAAVAPTSIVDQIVSNLPSVSTMAKNAAINAVTQLATTGNVDPAKVLTSVATGAVGTAVGATVGQDVLSATDSALAASVASGAAKGALQAVITGADPLQTALASGAASGLGSVAKDVGINVPQSVINSVVNSVASGAPLSQTLTGAALTIGTGLAKDAVLGTQAPAPVDTGVPSIPDQSAVQVSAAPQAEQPVDVALDSAGQQTVAQSSGALPSGADQVAEQPANKVIDVQNNPDNTSTYTFDDGSTITSDTSGNVVSVTNAITDTSAQNVADTGSQYHNEYTGSYVTDTGQGTQVIGDYVQPSTTTDQSAGALPTRLPVVDVTANATDNPYDTGENLVNNFTTTAPVVTTTVPVSGSSTASSAASTGTAASNAATTPKASDISTYIPPIPGYLRPTELSTGAVSQAPPLWAGIDPRLAQILTQRAAHGGQIHPRLMKVLHERGGELVPGPENRLYMRHAKRGFAVEGPGTGQSDDIPTMLSQDEYVIDADTVAALGDGSSKAGAEALDKMREEIRRHKRSAPVDKIPPKAKSPLEYLKMAKRK